MSKITYRFAGPGDIDALVRLRLEFLAEGFRGSGTVDGLAKPIRKYFSKMLPTGEFVAALGEADGGIVGVSGLVFDHHPPLVKNPTGLCPYVLNVYVRSEYRHRGIATKLLKMLIVRAKKSEARTMTLHFWPGKNELYANVGFKPRKREMMLELSLRKKTSRR